MLRGGFLWHENLFLRTHSHTTAADLPLPFKDKINSVILSGVWSVRGSRRRQRREGLFYASNLMRTQEVGGKSYCLRKARPRAEISAEFDQQQPRNLHTHRASLRWRFDICGNHDPAPHLSKKGCLANFQSNKAALVF